MYCRMFSDIHGLCSQILVEVSTQCSNPDCLQTLLYVPCGEEFVKISTWLKLLLKITIVWPKCYLLPSWGLSMCSCSLTSPKYLIYGTYCFCLYPRSLLTRILEGVPSNDKWEGRWHEILWVISPTVTTSTLLSFWTLPKDN